MQIRSGIDRRLRPLVATVIGICVFCVAPLAEAAGPTGEFAPFEACPYKNPEVQACLLAVSTGGSFKLGEAEVDLSVGPPISLQGGYSYSGVTSWSDAVGGPTLAPAELTIGGGILGLFNTGNHSGRLSEQFGASSPVNRVYATPELAGPVQFDLLNYLVGEGSSFVLPIKIHVQNPLLGPDCYIGTDADPIVPRLTNGSTDPPGGTEPLTGSPGDPSTNATGTFRIAPNTRLVDNTFSVPAAKGCGTLPLDSLVIDSVLNAKVDLPATAGESEFIFHGTTLAADRNAVLASVP